MSHNEKYNTLLKAADENLVYLEKKFTDEGSTMTEVQKALAQLAFVDGVIWAMNNLSTLGVGTK